MNSREERRMLLARLEATTVTYCSGCFLHTHHKKEFGRAKSHHFCISECTVGKDLQVLGQALNRNVKKKSLL